MASSDERLVVGTVSTIKWIQINSLSFLFLTSHLA